MSKAKIFSSMTAAVAFLAASSFSSALAQSQSCNLAGAPTQGLRSPLINGARQSLPFMSPREGAPPAIGDGACPAPVHPGMGGPPTLIPTNPDIPGGLGRCSETIQHDPSWTHAPGQFGPNTYVPAPPSTLGCDPGMIASPQGYYYPPVLETNVLPGGGLAGYAPTQKWGGQTTRDWGRYKYRGTRSYDWGQQAYYGQRSTDGPYQSLPGAQATQDLYGMRGCARTGQTVMTVAPY